MEAGYPAPRFEDPATARGVRERLAAVGFNRQDIAQRLGADLGGATSAEKRPLLLWRTRGLSPLDTLIRLFLMNVPVPLAAAERAFDLREWERLGLLRVAEGEVHPLVRLLPHAHLVCAADLNPSPGAPIRPDYVMGIGAASLTSANLAPRLPRRLTLDLGTGCGIQALLAAGHSEQVIATDRNDRAIAFATFNAQLNGIDNIRFLTGSLFEPLRRQYEGRFDLIVTNPPFVISPEASYLFRDSGMGGDKICQTIVRESPAYLAEGGWCQILPNWAHLRGVDWRERLASWFEGNGCDVWVLHSDTEEMVVYATTWLQQTETAADEARLAKWMNHYDALGIEAVSGGVITMRRRTVTNCRNWLRIDDAPPTMAGPVGNDIVSRFEAQDFLEAAGEEAAPLLAARFRVGDDVRLDHRMTWQDGQWQAVESILVRISGLAYRGKVDALILKLLAACDGAHPLGPLLESLADNVGRPAAEIVPPMLDLVRQLVRKGFLTRASDAG